MAPDPTLNVSPLLLPLTIMREAAVLRWSNLSDPACAAPGDADRLSARNLGGHVVQIEACDGGWATIRYGESTFRVHDRCLTRIEPVPFSVGEVVRVGQFEGVIRVMIWHFRDEAVNYYLERGGRKLSRRYLEHDFAARR